MSSASEFPAPHIIPAVEQHRYTVILLHERNSNGKEFQEQLAEGMTSERKTIFEQLPKSIKWIFPNARERYSTVSQGNLQEWFDIFSLTEPDILCDRQAEGLSECIRYFNNMIWDETMIVPPHHIILGGISQGFATASRVLFALPFALGGFIGISGWVPMKALPIPRMIRSLSTPVWITHSGDDSVVMIDHGEAAASGLLQLGYCVLTEICADGDHWPREPHGYDDLYEFIASCARR